MVVDGAASLGRAVVEALLGARGDLVHQVVDAIGGDEGCEKSDGDGLELHLDV